MSHEKPINTAHSAVKSRDQEVDHRIGNSLSILSALLRLQARRATTLEEAQTALSSAADRLNGVARIHFSLALHGSDGQVSLPDFLAELADNLSECFAIDVEVDSEEAMISADRASGLAMVISEIAMNAIKHGAAQSGMVVKVTAHVDAQGLLNVVAGDNGHGFPDKFDPANATGLGMTIITSTVEHLHGSLDVENAPGATFRIRIPMTPLYSVRDGEPAE